MSGFEGKVLFVAANDEWRELYEREAQRSAVEDADVLVGPNDAIDALFDLYEQRDLPAAIFCDGLDGGWRTIANIAKDEQIPTFVISGYPNAQSDIESEGATFIYKGTLELGFAATALAGIESPVAD